MKRTPMKRTAWLRRSKAAVFGGEVAVFQENSGQTVAQRSLSAIKPRAVLARIQAGPAPAILKDDTVRSEEYRRLVASLPCKNCGIAGYSQAAHLPPDGKGIKQDDRQIFALCCARVGITGCHADYDQYRLFTRPAAMTVGLAWAADTRREILSMGLWPTNLPKFPD